ncbi:MAG TPA: FAD-dependent oxidoreductase, partial [Anaerolineae bacterium]|nr:FAD-dependent oxidoreductase [Anaerolineae bacterium]
MPTKTRRSFLKLSSTVSLYALLSGLENILAQSEIHASTKGEKMTTETEIIVVGAGAAGLGAARALQDDGFEVILLEGRNRLGGRVWTDRSWPGTALDLGGSWIHGIKGNPLTELVKKFKIKTMLTDYDSLLTYDPQGRLLSDAAREKLDERLEKLLAAAAAWGEELDRDVSLQAGLDHAAAQHKLSPQEQRELTYAVNTAIEHEFAADVADLSLWYWDEGEDFSGGDVLFPGGYDQIFKRLAQALDIRLNQVVQKVEYGNGGVKIATN